MVARSAPCRLLQVALTALIAALSPAVSTAAPLEEELVAPVPDDDELLDPAPEEEELPLLPPDDEELLELPEDEELVDELDPELELDSAPLEELAVELPSSPLLDEPPPHPASSTVRARVAPNGSRGQRAKPDCARVATIVSPS